MTETLDPDSLPEEHAERRRLAEEVAQKVHAAMQQNQPLVASLHASDLLMLYPNERAYLDLFDEVALSVPEP